MTRITPESTVKLQKILSKRACRALSEEELERAYDALMGFAEALMDLDTPNIEPIPQSPQKPKRQLNHPIANNREGILHYV